jgi:peroxiredoxin
MSEVLRPYKRVFSPEERCIVLKAWPEQNAFPIVIPEIFCMLKVGDQAPEFTLFSSDNTKLSLSDLKGKNVLLLFFPKAFTSVCTAELCSVRDNMKQYESLNVQVLGISVDSLITQARFREEQQFNFPLLSDVNTEVSASYYSRYENMNFGMKGLSKRAAFLIDGAGVIRYAEVLEHPGEQPDFKAIQTAILALQG